MLMCRHRAVAMAHLLDLRRDRHGKLRRRNVTYQGRHGSKPENRDKDANEPDQKVTSRKGHACIIPSAPIRALGPDEGKTKATGHRIVASQMDERVLGTQRISISIA